MMDLREVKKEVESLANVEESLERLEECWLKPSSPFLQNLTEKDKEELNRKLAGLGRSFNGLKEGQRINEKLKHYARYLIELKLTTLNGDKEKSVLITNRLLNDEFLNFQRTIAEINSFKEQVDGLHSSYQQVNEWLQNKLTLEESLEFMDQPHKLHLQAVLKTAEKQKAVIKKLGEQLVELTRQTRMRR